PVLWQGDAVLTAFRRSRRPNLPRRSRQQLGEPGDRLPPVQRPQGQPVAERGWDAADPAAAGADPGIRAPDLPALSPAQARLRSAPLERPRRRLGTTERIGARGRLSDVPFRLLGFVADPSQASNLCGRAFAHY